MARTAVDYNFTDIKNSYFAYRKPKGVTHKQYTDFIKDCNKALIQFVIDGGILKMPFGLGSFLIERSIPVRRTDMIEGKPVPRYFLVDFNETLKLRREIEPTWGNKEWKEIPVQDRPFIIHTNEHTEGYTYKITWDRRECTSRKISFFQFEANHKSFKRELVKRLKSDNKPKYYDKH